LLRSIGVAHYEGKWAENYDEMLRHLIEDKEAIKVYIEVA
jgi:hypothetical protein